MGPGEGALPLTPAKSIQHARRPPSGRTPRVRWGRLATRAALAIAIAAFLPRPAAAVEAIHLSWDDCRPSSASSTNQAFACGENTAWLELLVAFESPSDLGATVIGIEAVLDVQHESPTLPDWWQMGGFGCRAGELLVGADFTSYSDCTDPWAGAAGGELQGFDVGQPRGQPNQVRIKGVAGVLPSEPVAIAAGPVYYGLRFRIHTALSTGAGSCAGCISGACLVLNGITIRRVAGAPGGDLLLTQPAGGDGNRVTWRSGGTADCQLVPVRAVTWGTIKTLYR